MSADRFRREIQVIARLQHPHIVPILAAGSADGALYYVMPFIGGETLRARVAREGSMPVADVARVLRELLDALAFAHSHGVIHRDIKPDNVLIEAGHAVVADFGVAKALRESGTMTSAGYSLGTPAYMAPEQATADPTADHRADLYAVGVLAYELVTGSPPFTGSSQQMITAHITTPPTAVRQRRSDVPEPLAGLIMRALEKEPGDRPQSAQEMLEALETVATPAPTTQAAPAPVASPRHSASWRTSAIAAALLIVEASRGAPGDRRCWQAPSRWLLRRSSPPMETRRSRESGAISSPPSARISMAWVRFASRHDRHAGLDRRRGKRCVPRESPRGKQAV